MYDMQSGSSSHRSRKENHHEICAVADASASNVSHKLTLWLLIVVGLFGSIAQTKDPEPSFSLLLTGNKGIDNDDVSVCSVFMGPAQAA